MTTTKVLATVTLTLLATACGGASRAPLQSGAEAGAPKGADPAGAPAQPSGYRQAQGLTSAPAEGEESGGAAAPAPPSSLGQSADSSARRAERQREALEDDGDRSRPGLATQWGETRTSRVTTAPFHREDSSNPDALATLFYNDREGARALASRTGFVGLDDAEFSVAGGAVTVSLRDASGNPLPAFRSSGKNFVVGESGQRYVIRLRNHTGTRLETVATVDGLDVIDGRDGSFEKRGYLLHPFSTLEIDGFRQSHDEVAAFRFGAVSSSYAASKGKARNVGVIGVAFFRERDSAWPWNGAELERRETADPFPARFAQPPR